MSDQDLIAAFLAKKAATVCAPGLAYGLDAEADKAKRTAARLDRRYAETEQQHDARMAQAHDAFFVGDRGEGYRLLGARW